MPLATIKAVAECEKNVESKKCSKREIQVSKTLERSERGRCSHDDASRKNRIMHAVQSSEGIKRQVRASFRDGEARETFSASITSR